jgi:fibronectin-binding autotransporter adhesin
MANKYWVAVGGTFNGTWDATTATNWSNTPTGSGGASAPISTDNVFIDVATLTDEFQYIIGGVGAVCNNITFTNGSAFTFDINFTNTLTVYGSVSITGSVTLGGTVNLLSTTSSTIKSSGRFYQLNFLGNGSYWTQTGGLYSTYTTVDVGATLDTSSVNNYTFDTSGSLTVNSSASVKLNASTVSLGAVSISSGGTVTMGSSVATATSFTVASGGTLNMGSAVTTVSGSTPFSITSGAAFTPSTGQVTLSTATITFSLPSYSFANLRFSGSGGAITLGSGTYAIVSFTGTSTVAISSGNTFSGAVSVSGSPISSLTINSGNVFSSSVTLSSATITSVAIFSNTFSSFTSSSAVSSFQIYDTSTFGATSFSTVPTYIYFRDPNTFSSLTFGARASVGVSNVTLDGTQTITGALTFTAPTNAAYRLFVSSNTPNVQKTISAGSATLNNVDFKDIAATGTTFAGTNIGNVGGNSGITFTTAKTSYWRGTTSASWSSTTSWSATSGGTATIAAFPLAQDTIVFPTTYPNNAATVTLNQPYNVGTIDMSLRTSNTMTLALGANNFNIVGDFKLGTGVTITSTGIMTFCGRNTQLLTTATRPFATALSINSPGGTVILQDSCSVTRAADSVVLTAGTIDLNGNTLTASSTTGNNLTITGSGYATNITFNGGGVTLLSSSAPFTNNGGNVYFTTTAGTGAGNISFVNGGLFTTGSSTYNCALNLAGSGILTVDGSATFYDITNTYRSVGAASIKFTAGTTTTFTNFNLLGTSANRCTLASTSTSQANLRKAGTWYMGANSTNVVGNTNLTFTAGGGADYLNVSYINGVTSGVTYLLSLSEDLAANDVEALISQYALSLAENITADNFASLISQYAFTLSENITSNDIQNIPNVFSLAISENFGVSQTSSIVSATLLYITENINAQDESTRAAAYAIVLEEAIQTGSYSAFLGRWVPIDTAQTPSWTVISDT